MITTGALADIFQTDMLRMAGWADHVNSTIERFGIVDIAAFIAHTGHESQLYYRLSENLNYGASGLMAVFPKYFTNKTAILYAREPQAIANLVYANRNGNGDEASGDGWRYRGRGLIQVTGADNYRACGLALGLDLINSPDILLDPEYAALSAGWFWRSRKIDGLSLEASTRRINGGLNGLDDRKRLFNRAVEVLA